MNERRLIIIVAGLCLAVTVSAQTRAVSFRSQDGNYWQMRSEKVTEQSVGKAQIVIRSDLPAQTFKGWGTCFNEQDYEAWRLLSEEDRTLFNKRAFNPNGDLRLQVGRIPVGASDYACDWYSCDETEGNVEDFTMEHFTIDRDLQRVIPSIKEALGENPDMTFWASPWSPPQWMKTNKHYAQLKTDTNGCPFGVPPYDNDQFVDDDRYYNAYCLYFDKFIEAYRGQGINITGLAYQNEAYSNTAYPGCSWKAATTGKFLAEYLGPYMAEHQPDLTLMVGTMNTNRYDVYQTILSTPNIDRYCKQIGFQWEGSQVMSAVHENWPQYEMVQTESECGGGTFDWKAAAHTFYLCNRYLAGGVTTYTYWNAILQDGGYSSWGWKQNALVQVNSSSKTAKYCAEFYAYKHYTHLIPAGSKILLCDEANLLTSALAPDGNIIVVIGNNGGSEKTLTLDIDGHALVCTVAPNSFATYVVGSETNVAQMLKSEAQGLVDIEQARLSSEQMTALNTAIGSGVYNDLLQAVGDVEGEALHNTILNPSFTSGAENWMTANVAASGDFKVATVLGKTCYNNWSNNFTSLDIHQDLTGLPEGLYTVTAKSVCGEGNISDQHVYAETSAHLVASPVKADDVWNADHWETQTTAVIYVAEGDYLRVGYASTSGGGTKGWFCVTDFELTRVGELTSEFDLEANRKTAPTALNEAREAYMAVVEQARQMVANETYTAELRNALASLIERQLAQLPEITEPALIGNLQRELEEAMQQLVIDNLQGQIITTGDATPLIESATITADTKTGWLRDNCQAAGYSEKPAAIQSSVHEGYGVSHWRGSAISDSKLIYQTVQGLPVGKYRLEAYAAATVWNSNNGNENKPGVYVFSGDERTEVTTATYGLYTVDFTLEESVPVTLGLQAKGNQGNTWCFLSDVKLTYLEGITTGNVIMENDKVDINDNAIFDLQGRRINAPTASGIYIKNGKKLVVK